MADPTPSVEQKATYVTNAFSTFSHSLNYKKPQVKEIEK